MFRDGCQLALKMVNCKWRQKFYHALVKHSGKALLAALKMIGLDGRAMLAVMAVGFLAKVIGTFVLDYLGVGF